MYIFAGVLYTAAIWSTGLAILITHDTLPRMVMNLCTACLIIYLSIQTTYCIRELVRQTEKSTWKWGAKPNSPKDRKSHSPFSSRHPSERRSIARKFSSVMEHGAKSQKDSPKYQYSPKRGLGSFPTSERIVSHEGDFIYIPQSSLESCYYFSPEKTKTP